MTHNELDSFVVKLKNLWSAGRNAKLSVETVAGKATVTLSVVDLDVPPHVQLLHQQRRPRNGPAQQRRRVRRAAAQQTAGALAGEAGEAPIEVAVSKTDELVAVEAAIVENVSEGNINTTRSTEQVFSGKDNVNAVSDPPEKEGFTESAKCEEVDDEFCSNEVFAAKQPSSESTPLLYKIVGEYRNPKMKPWQKLDPAEDLKILWEMIKSDNKEKGIFEIGDGSTCTEYCLEFWGTWKPMKPGIDQHFLEDSVNWPKGIKILEVKPG